MSDIWVAFTVYRCTRCGALAYPHDDFPNDPPMESCPCYMGPRWRRYEAVAEATPSGRSGGPDE